MDIIQFLLHLTIKIIIYKIIVIKYDKIEIKTFFTNKKESTLEQMPIGSSAYTTYWSFTKNYPAYNYKSGTVSTLITRLDKDHYIIDKKVKKIRG